MSEWQPIETAPKNGTLVLLYWPPIPYAKKNWGTIRLGTWNGSQWKLEMAGHFRLDCTHWMPLPAPPPPEGIREFIDGAKERQRMREEVIRNDPKIMAVIRRKPIRPDTVEASGLPDDRSAVDEQKAVR